jgi:uncharacterized protein
MEGTPQEVFDRLRRQWLDHPAPVDGEIYADDVVIEIPFAPAGQLSRFEGRRAFVEFANPRRAALPVRFDRCDVLAVHETKDPATIVVEYELTGTHLRTDKQSSAQFIGVLTVEDGKVKRWREYQDTLAMMQALQ